MLHEVIFGRAMYKETVTDSGMHGWQAENLSLHTVRQGTVESLIQKLINVLLFIADLVHLSRGHS